MMIIKGEFRAEAIFRTEEILNAASEIIEKGTSDSNSEIIYQ